MASLKDVISYIHNNYPNSQTSLSVERLIKIIYLADWKYAIAHNAQMTNVQWRISDFQPWMDKRSIKELIAVLTKIRVGTLLKISPWLRKKEERTIQFVIETIEDKSERELDRLVHSTHPAIVSNNVDTLKFSTLAADYNKTVKSLP